MLLPPDKSPTSEQCTSYLQNTTLVCKTNQRTNVQKDYPSRSRINIKKISINSITNFSDPEDGFDIIYDEEHHRKPRYNTKGLTTEPRTIESGKCTCRYGSLDYKSPFVGNKQPAELSPFYALKHFPGIVSPFTEALQEMARSEADLISIEAEQEARRVSQLEKIIQLLPAPCNALHVLQISGTYPKLSVAAKDYVQLMTQEQKEFYQTNIVCESLSDLCVATMGQSSCLRWHKEKKFRISSTTSHTILHARRSPEEVARAILNSRPFSTEATAYGLRTEPLARMEFERQLGVEVVEMGLLIHPDQPWLCGSPDGMFYLSGETCLLEIKCPHKCKEADMFDSSGESILDYIQGTGSNRRLKTTHRYFTQVQILLYLLNVQKCYFFVYSSRQNVIIEVSRDDAFLYESIPALERFYFTYLLPAAAAAK
ncbi:uncharacterized protein LOC119440104 [Dermacentor silvarum]|uniref:uncharacterized protein LOC119440104 n=1 Tax=Dermacentor silvarum TaxID=543639 RepID=UPI0021013A06|nr:uncharacterized protein LOC119440104 [Dermacentor silvarum]